MNQGNLSVIIVDDDEQWLRMLEFELRDRANVKATSDPAKASQWLLENDAGVLLTDQRMPTMRGVELVAYAAEHAPLVVRLMMTAYDDLQPAIDAVNEGRLDGYLRKPMPSSEVAKHLEEALVTARSRRLMKRMFESWLDSESFVIRALQQEIGDDFRKLFDAMESQLLRSLKSPEKDQAGLDALLDLVRRGQASVGVVDPVTDEPSGTTLLHEALLVAAATIHRMGCKEGFTITSGGDLNALVNVDPVLCASLLHMALTLARDFCEYPDNTMLSTSVSASEKERDIALTIEHRIVGHAPDGFKLLPDIEHGNGRALRRLAVLKAELNRVSGELSIRRVNPLVIKVTCWLPKAA